MKELEAIRDLARGIKEAFEQNRSEGRRYAADAQEYIYYELSDLLSALDAAIAERERLAIAQAFREAARDCDIPVVETENAKYMPSRQEIRTRILSRIPAADAKALDAHDAALWNEALEEAAQWIQDNGGEYRLKDTNWQAAKIRALKREKRGGE